ncbi:MAG: CBS domain-containing protein [Thermoprotei archaeon]|jgi:CBS domain-containing protein|nr:CBS domain-containing protein [Thermoprotei archaeon]
MGSSRRFEGYRALRSDGKPNFSDRIYRVEGDMERLARKPAIGVSQSTPIKEALAKMNTEKVRSLVISRGETYEGILLAENILDYMGGGELYNIVINRYEGNFFKCLEEPVKSIAEKNYPFVYTNSKLNEVIEKMIQNRVSILPVLHKDGRVFGVISEHDIVELLVEKRTGVTVGELSSPIISIHTYDPIIEAMRKIVSLGIRQIYVRNEVEQIVGSVGVKRIIEYFSSNEVYRWVKKGYLTEANSAQVREVTSFSTLKLPETMDVGEAAREMLNAGTSTALVSNGSEEIGMITEHDVFYALSFPVK